MTAQPETTDHAQWKIHYRDIDAYNAKIFAQRDALRAQQRGINRLKRRIDKMRHIELENAQLRRQVGELKATIKSLS